MGEPATGEPGEGDARDPVGTNGENEAATGFGRLGELMTQAAGWLDGTLYRSQHRALAFSTAPARVLWHSLMQRGVERPPAGEVAELGRRFEQLLERDYQNAERGYYPRSLLYGFPLAEYLAVWPASMMEFPRVWWRSVRSRHDELPVEASDDEYPSYYLRTFHWQSDGWLSDRSARLYDAGVEFLFGGTADVMRRMAIPPVVDAVGTRRRPRILDVGCGTGRFMLQLGKALPEAKMYGLDLSPFYLRRAQSVAGSALRDAGFVADDAEAMPFSDGYFDVVCAVYLFHELPRDRRRSVLAEMIRVLRPGGTIVLADSAQLADSSQLSEVLEGFPRTYHEPYYRSYLRDDLAGLAAESGLDVTDSSTWLLTRVVSARRPSGRGRSCQANSTSPKIATTK